MSSTSTCTKFHAHAWKKDLCVNCLKSKNVHTTAATNSMPSGTKRPAKPTGGKPVAAFRADVIRTSNRDKFENGLEERSKPSIAAKPSRLKNQGSNEGEESVEKSQACSPSEREGTSTRAADGGRRKSGTGTKSGRTSKRPMSPPPQAPNQPPPPPPAGSAPANGTSTVDGATVAEIMQQAVAASAANNSQEKHYYHKYDITGKGTSGQGQPASFVPPKNLLIEKFKLTHDTAPPFSASYKVDEVMSQPIAMPYTIVDVSTCPPSDAAPPKLPSSPAPERELGGGSSTTSSRTSSHSSSSLSSSSMLLDDSGSPLTGRRHSGSPARSHSGSVSPQVRHRAMREVSPLAEEGSTKMAVVLHGDSEKDKQFRSPTPPRKVPVFIQNNGRPSHTYEPIDQDDNLHTDNGNVLASTKTASSSAATDNANEEFVRQGNGRSSGAKSAAFEAKMAALSVLNLGKQSVASTDNNSTAPTDPQPPPPVKMPIENIELPIQTPPGKRKQKPAATNQAAKNKEPVDAKTDKNKKSKPGFFRRFLRFGSKEPEEGGSEDNGVDVSVVPESPAISEEPDISPPAQATNVKDTDRQSSVEQSAMLVDIRSVLAKRKSSTPGLDGIDLKLSIPTEPVVPAAERQISQDKSMNGQHSARGKDRASKPGVSDDRKEQENKYKALPVDLKTELLQKGIQSLKQSPKTQRKLAASAATTGTVIENNSPIRKPGKSKKPTVGPPSAPPLSPPLPPPPPPPSGAPLATPPVTQPGQAPPLPQGQLPPPPQSQPPPPPPPGSPPASTGRKPPKPTKKVSLKTSEMRDGPGDPPIGGSASMPPSKLSVIISDNITAVQQGMGTEEDGHAGKVLHVDTGLLPESPHSPRSGDLSPLSDTSGDGDSRPSRARSKADRNSKMCRSMMGAPPPPPDEGKRISGQDTSSPISPSASSLPSSPTRCIEISAPVAVGNASQTLPRNSYRREHSLGSAEDCSRYKKAVQGDSAAKHARNKTVTEGVKIDLQDITMRDRGMTDEECLAELADNRASKFLNRALPAPPVGQEASRGKKRGDSQRDSEEHDGDNIYELVPSERGSQIDRGTYEDIDDDDLDNSGEGGGLFQEFLHDVEVMFKSSSSQDLELNQLTSSEHPGKAAPDPPSKLFPHSASSDYLEPVTRRADAEGDEDKNRAGKSKTGKHWRPTPSPRSSNSKLGSLPNFSEPYVFMYANTDILLDRKRPALSIPEAMAKVAMLNIETLQEVTDRVLDRVMTGDGNWQEGPRWKDYSLPDTNPCLTQGYTCFYRTRTAKRQPYDGYLMISPRSVPKELCSCQHLHLLRPALMFSDRISAEYFPEPPEGTEVDHYQFYGMVQTNIAVFDYASVQSLESYLKELVVADNSKMKDYDRNVCYILSQIFSGVLYSRVQESPCVVNTLRPRDVLVVTSGEQEKYVVVNNVCQGPTGGETIGTLCQDLISVIFYLLNLQQPRDAELDSCQSRLPNRSTFSRGLQKVVQVLGAATSESLVTSWNMLQFMLWGPDEGALKSMNTADQKAHAFSMWLEVERSRAVSKVALEGSDLDIRTVNMYRYLYSCNGTVLFETSQLLSS